jgi:S-formylglutathione hydrolase FrmB
LAAVPADAGVFRHRNLVKDLNGKLHGQLVDFTSNHGSDRRIWSPALQEKRDLYVYLPPGFDPNQQYPIVIFMHGFLEDEKTLPRFVVRELDAAIANGHLPPVIVAAPDGSLSGRHLLSPGSFFLNSKAGRFEDFLVQDVWSFMTCNFPIRPEREAHVLAGASMGGCAAYNLAMKYPECFKVAVGIFPPLNLRWVDCHCDYMANFDPCCWGWRTSVKNGHEVVGRFLGGLVRIRLKHMIDPLYGRGPDAVASMSRENPIEMLERLDIKDGMLDMYIGYGGEDEFNIDAQVESFLYRAKERGLTITVDHDPEGNHSFGTALGFFPSMIKWLAPRLAPYSPCVPRE